jgi:hypothetical protein
MIEKFLINFPIFKVRFDEHDSLKNSLVEKIYKTNDSDWYNNKNNFNDRIDKTDWPIADDFTREWVKELIVPMYTQFNLFAHKMGYKNVVINKIWYQRYVNNNIHNWHIHGDNYSGVYYLELPENNKTSLTQFLYPDSLQESFCINAQEGDILFFPAFLIHRAPALQADKNKTIISWNLNFNSIGDSYTHDRERVEILNGNK